MHAQFWVGGRQEGQAVKDLSYVPVVQGGLNPAAIYITQLVNINAGQSWTELDEQDIRRSLWLVIDILQVSDRFPLFRISIIL